MTSSPPPTGPWPATSRSSSPCRSCGRSARSACQYEEADDRIIVVLEELVDAEEPSEDDGESVKVRLSRAQVSGFVQHSRDLVAAGRPPCRFCGLPVDPAGHPCPRMN